MSIFSNTKTISKENLVASFFKGLIVALLTSFSLVILFAFCLKWFSWLENFLFLGTMFIKIISTLLGALVAIKTNSKGLLKGIAFGLIYITIAFVVFSFLAGSFVFDNQTLLDFIACAIVGGIIGITKVNK